MGTIEMAPEGGIRAVEQSHEAITTNYTKELR
jgi:hypothetical protein